MNKFWRDHKPEVLIAVATIILITAFALTPAFRGLRMVDGANAGQFGDFIGGYFGTIFLIISVVLLYGSYRDQQATNARITFEGRFFELLKFHRENVAEIGIGDEKRGRRVFVSLIREFRGARRLVDEACRNSQPDYPLRERNDLAYTAIYYGVGPNSTRVLSAALNQRHPVELVDYLIGLMVRAQTEFRELDAKLRAPENLIPHVREHFVNLQKELVKKTGVAYRPYDGHQSRLGHYYRHLFQLIKYVKGHAPKNTALEYADIVRAQLTNHEQALLCLNAMANIGRAWLNLEYLVEFSLIQNIPESFFDPENEIDLQKEFPRIIFEFMKADKSTSEPNRAAD